MWEVRNIVLESPKVFQRWMFLNFVTLRDTCEYPAEEHLEILSQEYSEVFSDTGKHSGNYWI